MGRIDIQDFLFDGGVTARGLMIMISLDGMDQAVLCSYSLISEHGFLVKFT